MAAIPIISTLDNQTNIGGGNGGRMIEWKVGSFNSIDATGTMNTKLEVVEAVFFFHIAGATGEPATDEVLLAPTDLLTKPHVVGATRTITISRTGSAKTSGLKFGCILIGY